MSVLAQVLKLREAAYNNARQTIYRDGYLDALQQVIEIIEEETGVLVEED